jgi:D-alanyl-D-alanine dipeptidase
MSCRVCDRRRNNAGILFASAMIAGLMMNPAAGQNGLPAGFVYLRDVDPSIAQDIRYAGSDNFVGRPLAGYEGPECILRQEAAAALKRAQAELVPLGLSLKVYDCYRPTRAVQSMAAWANDGRSQSATKRFFPKLPKNALFSLGYIASRSQHSTGRAVDLTLIPAAGGPAPAFEPSAAYAPCTGPAAQRSPDNSVDMGTGFDCFDVKSHTASGGISAEQRRWRSTLGDAMRKQGFANYHREWWHFTYVRSGHASQHDFPIRPRALRPHADEPVAQRR